MVYRTRNLAAWRSVGRFAAVYVAVELSLRTAATAGVLVGLQDATARLAGALLNVFGGQTSVAGSVITAGASTVNVSGYCIPSSALALTTALMLAATPAPLLRRVLWVLMGVAAVLLMNVLRVALVGWLAGSVSPLLDAVHVNVLPVVLALTGIGCWAYALSWERKHG